MQVNKSYLSLNAIVEERVYVQGKVPITDWKFRQAVMPNNYPRDGTSNLHLTTIDHSYIPVIY